MIRKRLGWTLAAAAAAALFNLAAYGGTGSAERAQSAPSSPQPAQAQTPQPANVSPSDLRKLRWIEGAWRGTGDVEKPFFERYRFENETTLAVESFPDESLGKADDVTRFAIRDGQFGNWGAASRWAATRIDDNSITFEPVAGARNSFRWERQSEDVWQAVLDWPAAGDSPARRKVYRMERIPARR